jgi:hypothetical protein
MKAHSKFEKNTKNSNLCVVKFWGSPCFWRGTRGMCGNEMK